MKFVVTLKDKITKSLGEISQRHALLAAVKRGREGRADALRQLADSEAFRREVKAIKEKCIATLDELISKFTEHASARGAKVYFARTGEQACQYILKLAKEKNAKLIAKSKSLTTEEIELNHPLERAGFQVIETDLGERIIQMAGELPYHLVFPAVHKTAAQVAELFSRATGKSVTSELGDIMSLMRRTLRPIFLNADIGITGANVAIAETGALLIETNEGNGRLVCSIPPLHVVVVGVEKIVETIEQALMMIRAHPISATGQPLTTYVSFFAGRSPLGSSEGREFHIVLLDNGRFQMRNDDWFREALHCIRCGACMNICPTYGVLGGHIFGHIYPGPIGIPWTAQVHGLLNAAKFTDLCISCGLCKEICPAEIDMPMMIAKVKNQILEKQSQPLVNRVLMASEIFAKLACATAPVSNWILQSRGAKFLAQKIFGIDRRRSLPSFARQTFKQQFAKRAAPRDPNLEVAFFVDYFANYIHPEIAMLATSLLARAKIRVALPKQKTSGYPYISYGELQKAKKIALFNLQHIFPFIQAGNDLIMIEPTAAYAFKYVYPKLLDYSQPSVAAAQHTFEFFEYIKKLREEGVLLLPPQIMERRKFGYHIPCHQRALSSGSPTLQLLKSLGFDVEVIETGTCCGMAGTFGMKTGPLGYDLSNAVGEPLFEMFKDRGVDAILTESSVCKMQLQHGTGLQVLHPLELIARF